MTQLETICPRMAGFFGLKFLYKKKKHSDQLVDFGLKHCKNVLRMGCKDVVRKIKNGRWTECQFLKSGNPPSQPMKRFNLKILEKQNDIVQT